MNITPKIKRVIRERFNEGKWNGAYIDDQAVITIDGETYPLSTVLAAVGDPHEYKYTKDTQDEDMGQSHHDGDNPVDGDGTSESEE